MSLISPGDSWRVHISADILGRSTNPLVLKNSRAKSSGKTKKAPGVIISQINNNFPSFNV